MDFREFFIREAQEEDEAQYDEKELEAGRKEEEEHTEIYDIFETFIKENGLESPMSKKEFIDMLVKKHLSKDPTYYSKELETDEQTEETTDNNETEEN
jgi:hypothetical protein